MTRMIYGPIGCADEGSASCPGCLGVWQSPPQKNLRFVRCNPYHGNRQPSRLLPQKNPSDHFRGSCDYPLATV